MNHVYREVENKGNSYIYIANIFTHIFPIFLRHNTLISDKYNEG